LNSITDTIPDLLIVPKAFYFDKDQGMATIEGDVYGTRIHQNQYEHFYNNMYGAIQEPHLRENVLKVIVEGGWMLSIS
jgi:hypothetical protein